MVKWSWKKLFFGTTAAAIGAALLIANSPLALPKRAPFRLSQLENAVLSYINREATPTVKAGDLWKKKGAVLLVVRRAG